MKKKLSELKERCESAVVFVKSNETKCISENNILILRLFGMLIKNNQAILKLIKSNYFNESFCIHRLSIEHLFNIFALIKNPIFIEEMKKNSMIQISKSLNTLNNDMGREDINPLTPENRDELKKAIENYKKNPPDASGYSIFNSASEAELYGLYNSVYRPISNSHAHSTYLSAIKDSNSDDIDYLLENAISFLSIAQLAIQKKFTNSEVSSNI